ncbi:hypothetical protein GJAV_G00205120 [Gymnothorax javanicus]|nr:hypothetical protein GJAV_G00205120 [Gymnothorax javanicus]
MEKTPEALNLSFLLDHEREMILNVLQKDENLRRLEERRVRKLKSELQDMEGQMAQPSSQASERQCGRCQKPLGLIFDRGELCQACGLRVCGACSVSPAAGRWKCSACAKISFLSTRFYHSSSWQLKVVTGEWFLEERSKRFSQGNVPSSDVVKQSILYCPPGDGKADSDSVPSDGRAEEKAQRPPSSRRAPQHAANTAQRRGFHLDKRKCRTGHSVRSDSSRQRRTSPAPDPSSNPPSGSSPTPKCPREHCAVGETSDSQTAGSSFSPRKQSTDSGCSRTERNWPDGAESTACSLGSRGVVTGHRRTDTGFPSTAVTKDAVTPGVTMVMGDRDQSEVERGVLGSGQSDGAVSLSCVSGPGRLDVEDDSDNATAEDIDALMLAHRSATSATSTSTPSSSERKWGHLTVPADSDAETSSISSVMSVYSEAGDHGCARVSGEILLHMTYSCITSSLIVLVKECRNLAIGDSRRQRTDPYVKTYLLPDKSRQSKRKTSVKRNSISPVFNESLKYAISRCQLGSRTLQLSVWHSDRFGRNCFLGEAEVPFDSWDFESLREEWFSLLPKVAGSADPLLQYKGELTVVLKYIPADRCPPLPLDQVQEKKGFLKGKKSFVLPKGGMVELLIRDAKNLTAVKFGGTSDSFVKGYLLPDNDKSTKHKTAVVRKSVNPQWNHTFTYCGLQPADLNNVCLELTVWDKESLSSNVFLGGIRLGAGTGRSYGKEVDWMDSYGEEQRLWQRMIDRPEVPHECTLMLRSSMERHGP